MACPKLMCIVADKDEERFENLIEGNEAYEDEVFYGITNEDVYWYHLISPSKPNYIKESFANVFLKYFPFIAMRIEGTKYIYIKNKEQFLTMYEDMYDIKENKDVFVYHMTSPAERYELITHTPLFLLCKEKREKEQFKFLSSDDGTGEIYESVLEPDSALLFTNDTEIDILDGESNRIGTIDVLPSLDFTKIILLILK